MVLSRQSQVDRKIQWLYCMQQIASLSLLIIDPVEDTELPLTCICTCPFNTGYNIGSGTYISGVGLGRLALNRESDRLQE
jgi:hypothetical protein